MEEKYYKASGKVGVLGLVMFILGLVVVSSLLAVVYAFAIWYMPFIYISAIFTVLFAMGLGFWHRKFVVRMGKIRNFLVDTLFLLALIGVAYYIHWAVWVDLAMNISDVLGDKKIGVAVSSISIFEVLMLILDPSELWNLIKSINEVGVWSLKGNVVNGVFLWVFWIAELGIIFYVGITTGGGTSKKPYSEKRGLWYTEEEIKNVRGLTAAAEMSFKSSLERGEENVLDGLYNAGEGALGQLHHFIVYSLEGEVYGYLTANRTSVSLDKKGQMKVGEVKEIIHLMQVSYEFIERLKSLPVDGDVVDEEEDSDS